MKTRILQHEISYHFNDDDGLELNEIDIEHIEKAITDGYIQGELCQSLTNDNGDDIGEARGWWKIGEEEEKDDDQIYYCLTYFPEEKERKFILSPIYPENYEFTNGTNELPKFMFDTQDELNKFLVEEGGKVLIKRVSIH